MMPLILAGVAGGVVIAASGVYLCYRRNMNGARARIAAVDRHVVSTEWGAAEYAEQGQGDPVLYTLEAITVPTLIIHTKDDQMASHDASQCAAGRIPGARFVSLESGGHLMLGQTKSIRDELADFLAKRRERRAEAVAS